MPTILLVAVAGTALAAIPLKAVYLSEVNYVNVSSPHGHDMLRVICTRAKPYSGFRFFETVEFAVTIGSDDFSEYGGSTSEEVIKHYNEHRSLFSVTLFSQKRRRIEMSPFVQQCIGITSKQPYNVTLRSDPFNQAHFMLFLAGCVIIWSAGKLARNSVFYYLAGIVLGICASVLVIIALTSKLFPQRPLMYGMIIGGWTIALYVIKQLTDNVQLILLTYREYVLWYLAITGLISFLFCYRIGPPVNPRSQTIIKWVLQAIGGVMIYMSSWHSNACIVLLLMHFMAYYFPKSLVVFARRVYRRRFPAKRRLLSQEEYYKQAVTETARSLAELRYYVNSGNCSQWSIVSALRDPLRFASFANGAPHLYDEEIEDYSRTIERSMQGTDESEA
ncbi:hypothetical protein KR222_003195, partial [Zaprionus bogoriensis]